ncbi:MAG: GAF domain-containing protein [Terriglobales bacterium]
MDQYSILDNHQAGLDAAPPNLVSANLAPANMPLKTPAAPLGPSVREALRFPGEDGGKSLSEMAQRDLDATLQLLAERAQYITGASGAAIALRQGESMVCCASAGPSAPEMGAHLQIDSGLSAESVRSRKILICEDAENDPRVNRDSCRTFGIASVVVMPLVREEEVYGVFELLSGRPRAFEERDYVALNRLAEMIQTAVEHAEAARRAETELGQAGNAPAVIAASISTQTREPEVVAGSRSHILKTSSEVLEPETEAGPATVTVVHDTAPTLAVSSTVIEMPALVTNSHQHPADADASTPNSTIAFGNLRRCEACGFPVSQGRRLCLDCEAATPDAVAIADTQDMFGELSDSNTSWVRSHAYLIATALVAVATIALLAWRL